MCSVLRWILCLIGEYRVILRFLQMLEPITEAVIARKCFWRFLNIEFTKTRLFKHTFWVLNVNILAWNKGRGLFVISLCLYNFCEISSPDMRSQVSYQNIIPSIQRFTF